MKKTFGETLAGLRVDFDLTQKELADNLGLTRSQIKNYELDKSEPTIDTIRGIAKYFDVPIDFLLAEDKSYKNKDLKQLQNNITSIYLSLSESDRMKFVKRASLCLKIIYETIDEL